MSQDTNIIEQLLKLQQGPESFQKDISFRIWIYCWL